MKRQEKSDMMKTGMIFLLFVSALALAAQAAFALTSFVPADTYYDSGYSGYGTSGTYPGSAGYTSPYSYGYLVGVMPYYSYYSPYCFYCYPYYGYGYYPSYYPYYSGFYTFTYSSPSTYISYTSYAGIQSGTVVINKGDWFLGGTYASSQPVAAPTADKRSWFALGDP